MREPTRVLGVPRLIWWILAVACLAVITWASLIPSSQVPGPQVSDIVMHLLGYAVLAALFTLAQRQPRPVLTAAAIIGWGIVLEIAQGVGGLRSAEVKDVIVDAVGALFGVLSVMLVRRWLTRSKFNDPEHGETGVH